MAKEIVKATVDTITIYRTTGGKIAVKRSDRLKPSRYFDNIKDARKYTEEHFEGNVSENCS